MFTYCSAAWQCCLAQNVGILLTVDRHYIVEKLRPFLKGNSDKSSLLRAVMVNNGFITPEVSNVFGKAVLRGVRESKMTGFDAGFIASNIFRPALANLRKDDSAQWGLRGSNVADALRRAASDLAWSTGDVSDLGAIRLGVHEGNVAGNGFSVL